MNEFIATDLGSELYKVLRALDFKFFPDEVMARSKRDLSILIGMIAKHRLEMAEESNDV